MIQRKTLQDLIYYRCSHLKMLGIFKIEKMSFKPLVMESPHYKP